MGVQLGIVLKVNSGMQPDLCRTGGIRLNECFVVLETRFLHYFNSLILRPHTMFSFVCLTELFFTVLLNQSPQIKRSR